MNQDKKTQKLQQQLELVMAKFDKLTDYGLGISKSQSFEEERKKLAKNTDEFSKAVDWLSKQNKIKNINDRHTSYWLKHIAQHEIGYVSNGTFIAAAIYCGFEIKVSDRSPNVKFNISEKSIKLAKLKT